MEDETLLGLVTATKGIRKVRLVTELSNWGRLYRVNTHIKHLTLEICVYEKILWYLQLSCTLQCSMTFLDLILTLAELIKGKLNIYLNGNNERNCI